MSQDSRFRAEKINSIIEKAADACREASTKIEGVINDGVMDPELLVACADLPRDLRTSADDLCNLTLDADEY